MEEKYEEISDRAICSIIVTVICLCLLVSLPLFAGILTGVIYSGKTIHEDLIKCKDDYTYEALLKNITKSKTEDTFKIIFQVYSDGFPNENYPFFIVNEDYVTKHNLFHKLNNSEYVQLYHDCDCETHYQYSPFVCSEKYHLQRQSDSRYNSVIGFLMALSCIFLLILGLGICICSIFCMITTVTFVIGETQNFYYEQSKVEVIS
jgi:hypothetical protein